MSNKSASMASGSIKSRFSDKSEYTRLMAATRKVELECRVEALKIKQALEMSQLQQ